MPEETSQMHRMSEDSVDLMINPRMILIGQFLPYRSSLNKWTSDRSFQTAALGVKHTGKIQSALTNLIRVAMENDQSSL